MLQFLYSEKYESLLKKKGQKLSESIYAFDRVQDMRTNDMAGNICHIFQNQAYNPFFPSMK